MKKFLLPAVALLSASLGNAQLIDYDGMPVVIDAYTTQISTNGNFLIGLTPAGMFTFNRTTGALHDYFDAVPGNGTSTTDDGMTVGRTYDEKIYTYVCSTFKDGQATILPQLSKYGMGSFEAVTPDGSRMIGIVTNPNLTGDVMDPGFNSMMYLPFYIDRQEDGSYGEPQFLNVAGIKDFFGGVPQLCSAAWISADGKTIAGQVTSNNGFYCYPIIYKQQNSGEWEISYPSLPLFNPEGIKIPEFPVFDLKRPWPTDFMSSEADIKDFDDAYAYYIASGYDDEVNPFDHLELWMTSDQIKAYEEAEIAYKEAEDEYDKKYMEYNFVLEKVAASSAFFATGDFALSPDGNWLVSSRETVGFNANNTPVNYLQPYIFNLADGSYKITGKTDDILMSHQIFNDGTVIANTPPASLYADDETPVHSYILKSGETEYTLIEQYIEQWNPEFAQWLKENLYGDVVIGYTDQGTYNYKEMYVTGIISVADDFSVLAGGVDGYSIFADWLAPSLECYFSYIFAKNNAAVERIEDDLRESGILRVYNLQGMKVIETEDLNTVKSLDKGIYVINGKKVRI